MDIIKLRESQKIDCQHCQGMCCKALYFSKLDGFPENKKAGCPCVYLQKDYQCSVYDKLDDMALKGCMAYDCFGAGQLISQKSDHQSLEAVYQAFSIMVQLRQMLNYLIEAYSLYPTQNILNLINQCLSYETMNIEEIIHIDRVSYHHQVSFILKDICGQYPTYKKAMKKDHYHLDNLDMSMQVLIGEDLSQHSFKNSIFLGTDLRDCLLCGSDLSESLFLTQIQLNSAIGNHKTKIPSWLSRPRTWRK